MHRRLTNPRAAARHHMPTSIRRALLAATGLGLLLAVLPATPSAARRMNLPIAVRITGYVDQKPDGVNVPFEWVVSHKRAEIRLYIRKLTVKTGQVSASDLDNAVDPYPIAFQLAGERGAVQNLTTAAGGSPVTIDAYLQFGQGARVMMIESVKVEAVAATAPPATPAAQP